MSRVRREPCATCGGEISVRVGYGVEHDGSAIQKAVDAHRRSEQHLRGRPPFASCPCPIERASGIGCLVVTPGGRICYGCVLRGHVLAAQVVGLSPDIAIAMSARYDRDAHRQAKPRI